MKSVKNYTKEKQTMNKQTGSSPVKKIAFAVVAVALLITIIVLQMNTSAEIDPETYQPAVYSFDRKQTVIRGSV